MVVGKGGRLFESVTREDMHRMIDFLARGIVFAILPYFRGVRCYASFLSMTWESSAAVLDPHYLKEEPL